MKSSLFQLSPLNLTVAELNSPHFFYNFHPTIELAAKQYDSEMQKGTSRVAIASILWDEYIAVYRRIKNIYNNRVDDYFDDSDFPYLVYGIDSQHSRHHNSLFYYLKSIDDWTQMNRLVDIYDSIKSRKLFAANLQTGTIDYTDTQSIINELNSRLKHIVKVFFAHNSINMNHVEDYDVAEDVAQCRLFLPITHHRKATLITK